ncbi:MAG: Ig-like domain-containing protein [Clostridia bacterium]|nr:Ig-like domain-containing protein [Clostridia bacterium]
MKNRWMRALVALLMALLLTAALPSALMEQMDAEQADFSEAPALSEGIVFEGAVEPEVELAQDAGDTGLIVEYEQSEAETLPVYDELSGEELGESGLWLEGGDDIAAPDEADYSDLAAVPLVNVGYAATAPVTVVYADADLSLAVGSFPDGAVVYVSSVEREGAILRVCFDTLEARMVAQDFQTGYIAAVDVLGYTAEETEALLNTLNADSSTRYLDGIAIPCVNYDAQDYAVMAGETVVGLGVTPHSQAEIQVFVNEHPAYRNQINIYSLAAADEPYSFGRLSYVNQQSALNMVNQVRFIAGLNADVGLMPEQEDAMAATSLVLRLNGGLSHYPVRPAALADPGYDGLYQLGYTGAGHSNIAMGYTTTSSILAYMSDSDDSNIATVGHRRWIINPQMSRTVFGANGRFSAMYAHDVAGSGNQTKVAWPAQEMPLEYFSSTDPWSVSYGRALDASKLQVTLVRARDSRAWQFSQAQSDGYFNVENSYYGQVGCVIFRPNSLDGIANGDLFTVTITDGAANEVTQYTVHFFSLDLSLANPMDALNVTAIKTPSGNAVSWNPVAGASGYFVCRRTANSNYQIIADLNDTGYLDVNMFGDLTYYYQVYAHNASVTSRSAVSVEAKPVPPEAVSLSASGTVTMYSNATLQLGVGFTPSYASANLTWDSSKPGVATVDANGLVVPVKKGTAIISVRTDNGKSASVKVKVIAPPSPKKVVLSASGTLVMIPGETLQLSAVVQPADAPTGVTWSTSKAAVATVSDGTVYAQGEGTATITAKAVNGKKGKVKIKVVDPYKPDSVSLNYTGTVTLPMGQGLKLDASLAPATAQTTLTWTSSKPAVAAVDGSGNVVPVKEGTATITVKTANGKKAKVKLKVVDPYKPSAVGLNYTGTVTMQAGQVLKLDASLAPATAQTTLTWTSSRAAVVAVDGNGYVTALKKGSATVTVKTANGKKAKVKIKVVG